VPKSKLTEKDAELLEGRVPVDVIDFGEDEREFVEVHVYGEDGVYLDGTIIDDYRLAGDLAVKPGNDLRNLGFFNGKYTVNYNFLRRKAGSEKTFLVDGGGDVYTGAYYVSDVDGKIYRGTKPSEGETNDRPEELFLKDDKYYVHEISPTRKEVRVASYDIDDYNYVTSFEKLGYSEQTYTPEVDNIFGDIAIAEASESMNVGKTWLATLSDDDRGFDKDMVGSEITIKNAFIVGYNEHITYEKTPNPNYVQPGGDGKVEEERRDPVTGRRIEGEKGYGSGELRRGLETESSNPGNTEPTDVARRNETPAAYFAARKSRGRGGGGSTLRSGLGGTEDVGGDTPTGTGGRGREGGYG
jgi:hypothetical protein